ncbi:nitroreductase family protein [Radiobacillus sp. PE A8.2]|uniref:nitroreductase family protein n=1 Tax=Radiobacillus sp. PE A8.2 TaxID=3380349 RepID=UPI00388FF456
MTASEVAKQHRTADYEIDPIYINRWSPRSFQDKQIPDDILLSLFEAARWAPSSMNLQPWRFIIARTEEDRARFHSFINEMNLTWAKKAPVFALLISEREHEKGKNGSHKFDAGAAWGYLALEAVRKGLITHPMGGIDRDKAREVLQIPDNFTVDALIAIGYQAEKEALPEDVQKREKPSPRRPLTETLYEGAYNNPTANINKI